MKRSIIIVLVMSITLTSCDVFNHLKAFAKCEFEFEKVDNVKIGSVSIDKAKSLTDLGFTDIARLTQAVLSKQLLLEMTAVIKIKNPNAQNAALNRTDWILLIDNLEITRGTTNQRVEIPAQQSSYLPMHTSFNLIEMFSGKSKATLLNLANNIAGTGDNPSNVQLKLKPTISVAGIAIQYPNWITVDRKIGK